MKPPLLVFEPSPPHWAARLVGARTSLTSRAGLALAVAAFVWFVATGWRLAEAEELRAALQARLDAAQTAAPRAAVAAAALPGRAASTAGSAQRVRAWNTVAQQLNIPWTALLDTLEAVTPDDVALVAVEPQTAQPAVRLHAEARTLHALLAYQQALRAAPLFRDVMLARHETIEGHPARPVRVQLVLRMHALQGGPGK